MAKTERSAFVFSSVVDDDDDNDVEFLVLLLFSHFRHPELPSIKMSRL